MNYELKVFTEHYSKLCDTLTDVDNLLPQFVQIKIITTNDLEEINVMDPPTKKRKVQKFMTHIQVLSQLVTLKYSIPC